MKTPPLLLGAALLFWGWQTGLLITAAFIALILEGSRLVSFRFEFSRSDVNRFSDVSGIIFGGMFIYLLAATKSAQFVLTLITWLPMALLPLCIAQVYGTSEKIDISALFLVFRGKKTGEKARPVTLNISYLYFALCILSASAANSRTEAFYWGLFVLVCWALWSVRPRRCSLILWLALLLFSGVIGYMGQFGLHRLQLSLEKMALTSFADLFPKELDPYKARTSIGDLGSLKLSDKILFRVTPENLGGRSLLLRETSYKAYRNAIWFAPHTRFEEVRPEADRSTWRIGNDAGEEGETIIISQSLKNGRGMLKLPLTAWEITEFPVLKFTRNQYGAFKVEDGPGFVNFKVRFGKGSSLDAPPDEGDLHIPPDEKDAFLGLARELNLGSTSPKDTLQHLLQYFKDNFMYSIELKGRSTDATPLEDFLLSSKKGHCEFFATATVLLLRKAGIPARYVVGYSVQEFSKLEDCFVVRARHAHAWALAYIDGAWRNVDTTPPSWITTEEETASFFEPLKDILSYTLFKFAEWRWSEGEEGMTRYIGWLLIPLVLFILKRIHSRKRLSKDWEKREDKEVKDIREGTDSAFYLIEEKLAQSGYGRRASETLTDWLGRIETRHPQPVSFSPLRPILDLHYRYRFDPKGITADEKASLKNDVRSWLEKYEEIV
jgi:hypothetical protein